MILYNVKKKNYLPSVFSHKGKVLKESNIIANEFNQYFTDIGPSLANQINANHNFKEYLHSPADSRLILQSIDEHKVMKIIEHLKNKTSTGTDCISNKLIKTAKNELIKPLTIIINQTLHTGIFPEPLKISKVVPLYKANDQMILSNYSGLIPINIYLDLSKAFDTLLHDILLDKMSYYGVNGVAYNLLRSYLTQRQQIVEFDGFLSKSLEIKTGVPQGSVLGPFLFSIYSNDLPVSTNLLKMIMYADDTTLFCDINNIQNLEITLNAELLKITDWLAANKLSLNASKTKFMVFHSDKKIVRYPKLFINDVKIERVDCFNFLGLQLNHNLKWNKHISHVSLKISKITGLLHKLKLKFPTSILKSIYNTLLLPHINYCILTWGSQIDKIHKLQKRAIRNITKSDYRTHTEPLCKEHNLLN